MTTSAPLAERTGRDAQANPFVGPQAIPLGTPIYGRSRETASLLNLLVAERIVLLYSPSGAGKTSLVNAGLRPALVEDDFEVLPVASLRHEPGRPGAIPRNRFSLSIMSSLEQRRPADEQLSQDELSSLTLHRYLRTRTDLDDQPGNEVLIVDHFEEVLRVDPIGLDAKREFFVELGEALADRGLWALFVMREDYLASLDPYLRLIPTHFQAQYRLDLLQPDSARQAIVRPIEAAGVQIDDDAVTRLVDDLRRVKVLVGDEVRSTEGPYIEPVQLQVACHRLWEGLAPGQTRIGVGDVESLGDVDFALRTYFRASMAKVAEETGVPERTLRDWFQHELVMPNGLRSQVITGPGGPDVLARLVATHLLRAEDRHGATWYELSHDRLVEPVAADNALWADENLTDFERDAQLWDDQRRPDGLLMAGDALAAEELAVAEGRARHNPVEQAFVARSVEVHAARERERRSVRNTRRALVVALVGLLVAVVGGATAVVFGVTASNQRRAAATTAVVAAGERMVDADPEAALMIAADVMPDHGALTPQVRNLIGAAVIAGPVAGEVLGPKGLTTSNLATSRDGRWTVISVAPPAGAPKAAAGPGPQILVLDTSTGATLDATDVGDIPSSLGVSDAGQVAWIDAGGAVWWWDRDAGEAPRKFSTDAMALGVDDFPYSLVVAPDGTSLGLVVWHIDKDGGSSQQIATFATDGTPIGEPYATDEKDAYVNAWSWDGDLWVVGTRSGVTLGRLGSSTLAKLPLPAADANGFIVETSRDGTKALAADGSGHFYVWDTLTRELVWDQAVGGTLAALSADGSLLAVTRLDGTVEVYDIATRTLQGEFDLADRSQTNALWFLPDGQNRLVTIDSSGRTVIHDWRSEGHMTHPVRSVATTPGHVVAVNTDGGTTIWSPDGHMTASLPTGPSTGNIVFYDKGTVVVARASTDDNGTTAATIDAWRVDGSSKEATASIPLEGMDTITVLAAAGDGSGLAVSDGNWVEVLYPDSDGCTIDAQSSGGVVGLDYTDNDTLVVSSRQSVTEYDLSTSDCPKVSELPTTGDVLDSAVDPVTGNVAVLGYRDDVQLFADGVEQGRPLPVPPGTKAQEIAFLPGGDKLVVRNIDGAVRIYDVQERTLDPLRLEPGPVAHLATGPDLLVMAVRWRAAPVAVPLSDGSLRAIVRDRPTHTLTDGECERLLGKLCGR
ncbi:NACHT and WD repeat domain-containing protein [Cellulomonas sp. McL0617]|uniref:NACHT and WD repeat domain-containing protein n=1 Tax=Cellulomonas sp. McL0617 TaxID=3415675 RepID=UPI003CEDDCCD